MKRFYIQEFSPLRLMLVIACMLLLLLIPSLSNADTIVSSSIQTNTTWNLAGSPYIVTTDIYVQSNAKLTIQPGVIVKFNAGASLNIGNSGSSIGALDARGTASQPIAFTSSAATPAAGNWERLYFTERTDVAQTFVDNVIVEYAGGGSFNALEVWAPITITNSTFRNNGNIALKIKGASPVIKTNAFTNNASYAVEIEHDFNTATSPELRGNTYTTNGKNSISLKGLYFWNTILSSSKLTKDNAPYVVTTDLRIADNGTANSNPILTIEPGVTVRIAAGKKIEVGSDATHKGGLVAKGTAVAPIIFTSDAADPKAGDWVGISFDSDGTDIASTAVDYVTVEYAGAGSYNALEVQAPITITNSIFRNNGNIAVKIKGVSPIVKTNTFTNNASYGVEIEHEFTTPTSPELRGNTYTNNGKNSISLKGLSFWNTIRYSSKLTKDSVPYVVTTDLRIGDSNFSNNPILTIEPGVTIKIGAGKRIEVGVDATHKGGLMAKGTAVAPIIFTSDAAGPKAGDWVGISFDSDGTDIASTAVDYVTVEYAGGGSYNALEVYAPVSITNSIIKNNNNNGLVINSNGNFLIAKNQFLNNSKYGILSQTNAPLSISPNSFINNILGGVNVGSSGSIAAQANWWGHASGPSGIGSGTGQAAVGNVAYEPWLGEIFNPNLFFNNVVVTPKTFNQSQGSTSFYSVPNKNVNWTITIKNSGNTTVKTLSGTGTTINQSWMGTDNSNQILPNGTYSYVIAVSDPATPATTSSLIGKVILDNTIPLAKISAPQPYGTFGNQIQVSGTAAGTGFSSYTLEYGVGENPIQWTQIATSTTPVTNGVLGTWTIPPFSNPLARIRLTVRNAQNATAVDSVPVFIYSVYNLNDDTDPFSPDADNVKDTTNISANFTLLSNYTLTIKNSAQTVVRTFTGSGNSLQFPWNGKNQAGSFVADGTYNYQISAINTQSAVSTLSALGTVVVDRTLPTASFSAPAANAVVSGAVTVSGAATDTNFSSYELEYGAGDVPTVWTRIILSTTKVLSGTLGVWDTKYLSNGIYNLRLTVKDSVGHTRVVTRKVSLDNIRITNVSTNPKFINPAQNQTAALSFTLDRPANVTVEIYREGVTIGGGGDGTFFREFQFNLTSNLAKPAGVNTVTWNGKNAQNQIMPPFAYGYAIKAVSGTKSGTYDPQYVSGGVSITNFSLSPNVFNPFANETVQLNYTLSAPAWVTIGGDYPAMFPSFIVEGKPRPSGANTEIWDGRDGLGTIFQDSVPLTVSLKTEMMPAAVTVIPDTGLQITALKTNPYLIFPAYNEFTTINYTINRTADVMLRVIDPNGSSWVLTQGTAQAAGSYTYQWKGLSSNGSYLRIPGNYRIEVTATEPATSTTVRRSANVSIYK